MDKSQIREHMKSLVQMAVLSAAWTRSRATRSSCPRAVPLTANTTSLIWRTLRRSKAMRFA